MPRFYTYGVHAFLQLYDASSAASPGPAIIESAATVKWSPMQGMTHPISTTTIVSPAKVFPQPPVPFRIVVDFDPDIRLPHRQPSAGQEHLRGDVRIEIKIDGSVRGWRILPQAKIWPRGARVEFSGSRVGRTEERAFVFTSLPSNTKKDNLPTHANSPPASAFDPHPEHLPDDDPTLVPHTPTNLPLNASHIQILITLGKKHDTLEKYLIFSPVLQEAFYVPPGLTRPPTEVPESSASIITRGVKRKAGTSPRTKKKETKIDAAHSLSILLPAVLKNEKLNDVEESAKGDMSETTIWKPVGLAGTSQKTAQMREAEFTARIHLARFWFFVVPDPAYMPLHPQGCSVLISSSNGQQNTRSDELAKNQTEILGLTQKHPGELDQVKLEGSDACEREGLKELLKENEISEFSSDSSQTKEEDSQKQFIEASRPTNQGHHVEAADQISTTSTLSGNVSQFRKSVEHLTGLANLENSWTPKHLAAKEGTKSINEECTQGSETKIWSDTNPDQSILQSGPHMLPDSDQTAEADGVVWSEKGEDSSLAL